MPEPHLGLTERRHRKRRDMDKTNIGAVIVLLFLGAIAGKVIDMLISSNVLRSVYVQQKSEPKRACPVKPDR